MRKFGLIGMFAVAVLVAGCGDSTSDPEESDGVDVTSDAGSDGGGDSDAAGIRACDLVTLDQLSEVLDREVIFDPSSDQETTCSYLSSDTLPLVMSIDAFPVDGTADEVIGFVVEQFDDAEEVDIGEAGYIVFGGAQVGFVVDGIEYQVNLTGNLDSSENSELTLAVARLIEENI